MSAKWQKGINSFMSLCSLSFISGNHTNHALNAAILDWLITSFFFAAFQQ
jgi:hypothetical protein